MRKDFKELMDCSFVHNTLYSKKNNKWTIHTHFWFGPDEDYEDFFDLLSSLPVTNGDKKLSFDPFTDEVVYTEGGSSKTTYSINRFTKLSPTEAYKELKESIDEVLKSDTINMDAEVPTTCNRFNHEWKLYKGFHMDEFEYCVKCGIKRKDVK